MRKQHLLDYFEALAPTRDDWKRRNWYYHDSLKRLMQFFIPRGVSVLEIGSGTGDLLAAVAPHYGMGVDISPQMIDIARRKYPLFTWQVEDAEHLALQERFDYIIMSDLIGFVDDIEKVFSNVRNVSHTKTKVVVTCYNYAWEPIIHLAEMCGFKDRQPIQNWISLKDIENMFLLAGFEVIKRGGMMLMPVWIPFVSKTFNKMVAHLPIMWRFSLVQYAVARPLVQHRREYSVSVIIPARNEKGNIERAVKDMPRFGRTQEIIFVEGHSRDRTLEEIKRVAEAYASTHTIRWAVQEGEGKGDAVRKGFAMAEGEILMILDADLTVRPEDLLKFYEALASGRGEFINGSRLVYPLEKDSMRILNIAGNKCFSVIFSWLLDQRIKDTLCGTKTLFKEDYEKIVSGRSYFGEFDPFGDFDLLLGAAKLNLKIIEVPVRYQARVYGKTNIQRWKHGWLLLKMAWFALWKIKFI
jgi:SAM-dependent methyltransferase